MSAVIEVSGLRKVYRTWFARRVEAVRDVSLRVEEGQVFGFLGPNGAGKTTTIRTLVGIVRATSGSVKLFGKDAPSRESRERIGFLPESPYFYDYLTVTELIDLAGRLCGVARATRRARIDELIAMVGLERARNTRLQKYSKGMLQRAGIAQALIHDPDLVVFDEPMTGLDPVGRKEVRDIIGSLAERGKTVFFSSHIMADVEAVCDHVAFVAQGTVRRSGAISELVDRTVRGYEVTFAIEGAAGEKLEDLRRRGQPLRSGPHELRLQLEAEADVDGVLAAGREAGARVRSVEPRHQSLEEVFLQATAADPGEERAA